MREDWEIYRWQAQIKAMGMPELYDEGYQAVYMRCDTALQVAS